MKALSKILMTKGEAGDCVGCGTKNTPVVGIVWRTGHPVQKRLELCPYCAYSLGHELELASDLVRKEQRADAVA